MSITGLRSYYFVEDGNGTLTLDWLTSKPIFFLFY